MGLVLPDDLADERVGGISAPPMMGSRLEPVPLDLIRAPANLNWLFM
jgi:hypothetical protein